MELEFMLRAYNAALSDLWIKGFLSAKLGQEPRVFALSLIEYDQGTKTLKTAGGITPAEVLAALKLFCSVTGAICPIIQDINA